MPFVGYECPLCRARDLDSSDHDLAKGRLDGMCRAAAKAERERVLAEVEQFAETLETRAVPPEYSRNKFEGYEPGWEDADLHSASELRELVRRLRAGKSDG